MSSQDRLHAKIMHLIPLALFWCNVGLSFVLLRSLVPFVIFGGILSWGYSSHAVGLKRKPLARLVLNASGFSFLFLMGAGARGSISGRQLLLFVFLFILFLPIEIIHNLNDMRDDQQHQVYTLPLVAGVARTLTFTGIIFAVIVLYAGFLYAIRAVTVSFVLATCAACVALSLLLRAYFRSGGHKKGGVAIKARAKFILSVYGFLLLLIFLRGM